MTKISFGAVVLLLLRLNGHATDYDRISDVLAATLPSLALGATLYLHDRNGTKDFAYSMGANLAATAALKYTIDATRPNGQKHSFPSGHTSVSFQSAAFVHRRYGWQYAAGMYAGAALVAYCRVQGRKHYVRDVVAGALLGAGLGYAMTRHYRGFEVQAGTSKTPIGLTLSKCW
jgi:membrane-associated phospholipid phosphatase